MAKTTLVRGAKYMLDDSLATYLGNARNPRTAESFGVFKMDNGQQTKLPLADCKGLELYLEEWTLEDEMEERADIARKER